MSKASAEGMMLGMVDISLDGTEAKPVTPPTAFSANTQQFLGVSEDGKHVVLEHAGKGKAFVHKQ